MDMPRIRVGFVGFGEVHTPRDVIERKCAEARRSLEAGGLELAWTAPVNDHPLGEQEARARRELSGKDFDLLIACVAGWIPSQPVINVLSDFAHKPVVLWGLTGWHEKGRFVTTADQAGTSALRDAVEGLGFRYKYVYECADAPGRSADKVLAFARVAKAAAMLRAARVGMMGYRDMNLYGTLVDQVSLRRVIGPEVEVFDTLEVTQAMERLDETEVTGLIEELLCEWTFEQPVQRRTLEKGVRLYLAVMAKVRERGYQAVSLVDVYGVKKLLQFPPAMVLMLLADKGGVVSIPENDGLGAVTQLMVRYLTGQAAPYMEFYEYMTDRVLLGVPDYVPSAVVDGPVRLLPWPEFGGFNEGVLNVSKVRTGPVTICRLGSRGDRYRLHVATGEAVPPRDWAECGWADPAPHLPSIEVVLDGPVDDFAQKVLGQHYIVAYGDVRQQLADLCRLLGIDVI